MTYCKLEIKPIDIIKRMEHSCIYITQYDIGIVVGNIDRVKSDFYLFMDICHDQLCDAIEQYNNWNGPASAMNGNVMLSELLTNAKIDIADIFSYYACAQYLNIFMIDLQQYKIPIQFVTFNAMTELLENYWSSLKASDNVKWQVNARTRPFKRTLYDPTQSVNFLRTSDKSCVLKYDH